jgi:hypothetical protein
VRDSDSEGGGVDGGLDGGVEEPVPETEDVSEIDGELSRFAASSSAAVLRLFVALSVMATVGDDD